MASKIIFQNNLKELRLILCHSSNSSAGMCEFVQKYYVLLKASNPNVSILIRECTRVEPRLHARFKFGKELTVPMSNVNAEGVLKKIVEFSNEK